MALRHRIVGESLRLLRLILTLVKLSVLQQLATVRSGDLLCAALVALAGQLLRWLVVFASDLAGDCHIVVIRGVVRVRVLRQDFG